MTQSTGYSDEAILQRVIEASREVVAGRAAYERDSILFAEAAVPFQLVAGILRSAAMDGGRVRVVDIGGSLGSTYRQCRSFLSTLESLEWHIVEQAEFVDAGKREFSTPELQFHAAIDDVPSEATPSTFLLSSSLQYIERPYELLSSLTTMPARHLLIDRTPISEAANDRLSIQQAPKSVYDASYPCWIFSREQLTQRLLQDWSIVTDYLSPEGAHRTADGTPFEFRGLILERRS